MADSFTDTSGAAIRINCPVCAAQSVPAAIHGRDHLLLYAFPIYREVYVRCSICQAESRVVHAKLDQLALLDADQIDRYLVPPAGRTGKMRAVLALGISWVPFVGLYFAWQAWRRNRGTHGLAVAASVAALVIAGMASLSVLMALVMIPVVLLVKK